MKRFLFLSGLIAGLSACVPTDSSHSPNEAQMSGSESGYPQSAYDALAISNPEKMSAASKRALERGYHKNVDWFGVFSSQELTGDFAYDPNVIRRDPSAVLKIDGIYYTWYSRSTGESHGFTGDPEKKVFQWDRTDIWYASSKDGWHWEEQGIAVGRGATGRYDDRSVFTPEIMEHDGKFYLIYQAVKAPYAMRVKNTVGMAVADSPHGPWRVLDKPILEPADNGVWDGEADDRFAAKVQGDFDSHKVHDPTLIYYKNKFYLYYKGERMGERYTSGGREIRWGLAIADHPEGPYIKSEYNPITQSGHEICIWPYQGGIAMLSTADGPERLTIQYAEDGINFEIRSYIANTPHALGLYRGMDTEKHPLAGLEWGLQHEYVEEEGVRWYKWGNYIKRFRFQPRTRNSM